MPAIKTVSSCQTERPDDLIPCQGAPLAFYTRSCYHTYTHSLLGGVEEDEDVDMQRRMPVTITIRGELLQRVDELAASKRQNRSQFVSELLDRFLPRIEQEIADAEQEEALAILGRRPARAKTAKR